MDIRGPGGAQAIPITSPTQVITMQLWATVTNGNGNPADDGLWKFYSSFLSSANGLVKGDLSNAWAPGTPFNAGSGASLGTAQDLDGDGDKDIGSNNDPDPAPPFFQARAAAMVTGAAEFYVLDLTFTGTAWSGSNPHGTTTIEARGRNNATANLWKEDNVNKSGVAKTGKKVVLYRPAEADAGADIVLNPGEDALLNGSASIGTIDEWAWSIDGIPLGVGETLPVTFDGLLALVGYGPHTVELATTSEYTSDTDTMTLTLLPEPATLALVGLGLVAALRRRRA